MLLTAWEFWPFAGIAAGLLVMGIIFGFVKNPCKWLIRHIVRFSTRHNFPGRKDSERHKAIYTYLNELRALTDADRAYIIQFHNGYEFLLNDPIWKCTCTHEVVRPGITYESINSQNLLVSRVFELVEPIISGHRSVSGITKSPCCVTCARNAECERMHKYLSVVQVEEMPFGYVKFLFQQRNIKTLIVCGLTNKHGAFGILGIDITSAPIVDSSQLGCLSLRVCRAAECIRFLFLKKDILKEPSS